MIEKYRTFFNANFSEQKYQDFLTRITEGYPEITFRLAESPVFLPEELKQQLITAGNEIIALIKRDDFKEITQKAIPIDWKVPNENDHPHFLTFDFGVCSDEQGKIKPMLIEMQGFPSLYGFQNHLANTYKESFDLDQQLTPFLMA